MSPKTKKVLIPSIELVTFKQLPVRLQKIKKKINFPAPTPIVILQFVSPTPSVFIDSTENWLYRDWSYFHFINVTLTDLATNKDAIDCFIKMKLAMINQAAMLKTPAEQTYSVVSHGWDDSQVNLVRMGDGTVPDIYDVYTKPVYYLNPRFILDPTGDGGSGQGSISPTPPPPPAPPYR